MSVGKLAGNFSNYFIYSFIHSKFEQILLDDIGWIAKLHSEAIQKKKTTKALFPTRLCQEIEYCQKSPELTKKTTVEEVAPYW